MLMPNLREQIYKQYVPIISKITMKKTLFTFAALLALAFSAMAQDTILGSALPGNYLFHGYYPTEQDEFNQMKMGRYGGPATGGEYCIRFTTSDSVTVYGIAAGLYDALHSESSHLLDTSHDESIEHLRLYLPGADSLRWVRQAQVHMKHTPVSYYIAFDSALNYRPPYQTNYMAMYERYFEPITVCDSFYAGLTYFLERHLWTWDDVNSEWVWHLRCPPIWLTTIGREDSTLNTSESDCMHFIADYPNDSTVHTWLHSSRNYNNGFGYTMIFPILTPPDSNYVGDTTVVHRDTTMVGDTIIICDTIIFGNDTVIRYDTILGIEDHSLLQRLTGVMPNPAAETAKVVSSFGMTLVEVYNMAGEKVHTLRLPDAPLTATLDVGHWPSGAYILRIHTPQGVAVKKLAVRH